MNSFIFVDVQGFKDCYNQFIIKELALSTKEFTQVYLIKPPYAYNTLSREEKKTVRYLERERGITWSEGHIDYREFKRIIIPLIENKIIIMKGLEKQKWIKELCENCVLVDIEDRGSPNFMTLYKNYCKNECNFNCLSHAKFCALKNVICIKKWSLENNILNNLLV